MSSPQQEKQEVWNRFKDYTTNLQKVAAALALVAGLAGVFGTFFFGKQVQEKAISSAQAAEIERTLATLKESVANAQLQTELNRKFLDALDQIPKEQLRMAKFITQINAVQLELKTLEDAIGQSPEKTLSAPLLRKDMDNLRESSRHDVDATQVEINRVYDQNKWFIGLMFTMAVGLVGLAISNFVQARKPEPKPNKEVE